MRRALLLALAAAAEEPPLRVRAFLHAFEGANPSLRASLGALCEMERDMGWTVNATVFAAGDCDGSIDCSYGGARGALAVDVVRFPRSVGAGLAYAHRPALLAARGAADVFLVAEDDVVVRAANVVAFLAAAARLPEKYVPGFARYEHLPHGGDHDEGLATHASSQGPRRVVADAPRVVCDSARLWDHDVRDLGGEPCLVLPRHYAASYALAPAHLAALAAKAPPDFWEIPAAPPESLPREHAVVDVYWKFDLVKVIPISLFSASLVQHVRNNAHERHGLRNCPLEAEILARLARKAGHFPYAIASNAR